MSTNSVLLSVLLVVAIGVCAIGIWALIESAKAARSLRALADDLDMRAVPLLEKADVTIDALNAEILRADAIVTRIEQVTDRVESTSRAVQEVASAPAEIVTDIADRVRRAWRRRQAESAANAAARAASCASEAAAPEAAETDVAQPVAQPDAERPDTHEPIVTHDEATSG